MEKKRIGVLGCGWYGMALAKALRDEGYSVHGSTTSAHKLPALRDTGIRPFLVNLEDEPPVPDLFFDVDMVICGIPPTDIGKFNLSVQQLIQRLKAAGVPQLIFISSIGVYSNLNRLETELTEPEPDTEKGRALLRAEKDLKCQPDFTTTIIRFGGLIGPGRDLGRYFSGKKAIADGLAPVNLIHLEDCIGITQAILRKEAYGNCYNAVYPQHPSRAGFYTQLCAKAGLELPDFIPEKKAWKQVDSVNIPLFLAYTWQSKLM